MMRRLASQGRLRASLSAVLLKVVLMPRYPGCGTSFNVARRHHVLAVGKELDSPVVPCDAVELLLLAALE
jgi:hypothetical protein